MKKERPDDAEVRFRVAAVPEADKSPLDPIDALSLVDLRFLFPEDLEFERDQTPPREVDWFIDANHPI